MPVLTLSESTVAEQDWAHSGRRLVPFDHPSVCRAYLIGCCPYELVADSRLQVTFYELQKMQTSDTFSSFDVTIYWNILSSPFKLRRREKWEGIRKKVEKDHSAIPLNLYSKANIVKCYFLSNH